MTRRILNTRFLLVDDDADDAHLFCEALSHLGPEIACYTAEDGIELFELLPTLDAGKPDVIFLDINMPVMNGWDCLIKLKENPGYKDIPTIMYSTSSARKDIEMAYELGALLFLTKPDDFKELSLILETVAVSAPNDLFNQLKKFESVKTK